jgi:hypothetical protein
MKPCVQTSVPPKKERKRRREKLKGQSRRKDK